MRFTDAQLRRLAEALLDRLIQTGGVVLRTERSRVLARIESTVRANLVAEQAIDREAQRLLEAHLAVAPPGVDRQKLFIMIKKRLAEQKGFPL